MMAAIKKLANGRYRLDYRDQNGKRWRETFDRLREADDRRDEVKQAVKASSFVAAKKIPTFGEVAEEWFKGKRNYRVSTLAAWRVHLDRHLLPKLGNIRLQRVTVIVMEDLRDELFDSRLSAQTVNKVLTTATVIFKLAIRRSYTRSNPARDAERLRASSGELSTPDALPKSDGKLTDTDVLNSEEIRRLLLEADEGFYRALFLTTVLTGARSGEALALQWSDVDLEAGKVYIRRSLSWAKERHETGMPKPRFYQPKTVSGNRVLPIPPELVSSLRRWKLRCPAGPCSLVFPTLSGTPTHRSNVLRYGLFPALRRANLKRVNMHSLRHSFASNLLASGAPIAEVAALMGHSNPTTTLKIYTYWVQKTDTGAIATLAKSICDESQTPSANPDGHFLDTLGKSEAT